MWSFLLDAFIDFAFELGVGRAGRAVYRSLPLRLRHGASWRWHARRMILARRTAMKGMA